jgi:hypothetical protein
MGAKTMSAISLSWLEIITLILSVYVFAESVPAFCKMPERYQMLCHKAKYVVSAASALAVMYYIFMPLPEFVQWLLFGLMGNITLFIWPRMVWRFKRLMNCLDLFLMEEGVHDEG